MMCELVTPCSRPLPDISGHFCAYVKIVLKKYLRLSLDIFVDVRNIVRSIPRARNYSMWDGVHEPGIAYCRRCVMV
jgi:hypothetical protein